MSNNKQAEPKQTKSEKFQKLANCKNNHSSPISNTACTHLNSKADVVKLQNLCGKDGCKCQIRVCFTPKQFEMEGAGFKNLMKKNLKGS